MYRKSLRQLCAGLALTVFAFAALPFAAAQGTWFGSLIWYVAWASLVLGIFAIIIALMNSIPNSRS
jgi:hypothetical protein